MIVESRHPNGGGHHGPGNNYKKGHKDHDTPNDKARAEGPSASTPAATSGNMDYRHVVVGGQQVERTTRHLQDRTLLSKVKSKLGNTCANVYTQGKEWTRMAPMTSTKKMQESP
jgi:hypothetical protein